MKNLPLTIDGVPNTSNPFVVVGILDVIGINLTNTLNDIGARGSVTGDDARMLIGVQQLLRNLRDTYGWQHDVSDSCVDVAQLMDEEIRAHREKRDATLALELEEMRKIAKQLGIENIFAKYAEDFGVKVSKPSAADVADSILDDLRTSGSIGGSRAV